MCVRAGVVQLLITRRRCVSCRVLCCCSLQGMQEVAKDKARSHLDDDDREELK